MTRRCPCVLHAWGTRPERDLLCICECDHSPDERRWALVENASIRPERSEA